MRLMSYTAAGSWAAGSEFRVYGFGLGSLGFRVLILVCPVVGESSFRASS